jgi:hypothetical protein
MLYLDSVKPPLDNRERIVEPASVTSALVDHATDSGPESESEIGLSNWIQSRLMSSIPLSRARLSMQTRGVALVTWDLFLDSMHRMSTVAIP